MSWNDLYELFDSLGSQTLATSTEGFLDLLQMFADLMVQPYFLTQEIVTSLKGES